MKPLILLKKLFGSVTNCQKVNDFLADYVEGTLPEKTVKQFEEHIGSCACCGTYFDQYRNTIDLIKEGKEVKIPAELAEHTMSFLRKNANFS